MRYSEQDRLRYQLKLRKFFLITTHIRRSIVTEIINAHKYRLTDINKTFITGEKAANKRATARIKKMFFNEENISMLNYKWIFSTILGEIISEKKRG
ncbi:hypothetical protein D3790_06495 [Xenorhabdus nematophila]|nr:hypothetical protein D3790_06495 [Xenorhabdus nematophila]KHD28301.1 hypothetical protein LH67_11825 [Xenorhabdus nematophila]